MNRRDLKLRMRALFRRHHVEQELNDELAFHIERETKRLIDHGLAPTAAQLVEDDLEGAIDNCRTSCW